MNDRIEYIIRQIGTEDVDDTIVNFTKVGYSSTGMMDVGVIYAPYIPLQITNISSSPIKISFSPMKTRFRPTPRNRKRYP